MKEQIRDNSERSKDITLVFYTFIGIHIISILLIIYQSYIIKNYTNTARNISIVELLDIIVAVVRVALFIINIIAIIFFVRWFKRAYGNLIRKDQPMQYGENWIAWGFFIPIVFFYQPITTAKEIFLKTQYAIKEYNSMLRIDTDTSFISLWWIIYWVNIFFSNYAYNKLKIASDIPQFIDANSSILISEIITIIGIILTLYLIHKITKQETLLRETNESVSGIDEIGKAIE
jgi:uncharacterized membrane protein